MITQATSIDNLCLLYEGWVRRSFSLISRLLSSCSRRRHGSEQLRARKVRNDSTSACEYRCDVVVRFARLIASCPAGVARWSRSPPSCRVECRCCFCCELMAWLLPASFAPRLRCSVVLGSSRTLQMVDLATLSAREQFITFSEPSQSHAASRENCEEQIHALSRASTHMT